MLASPKLFADPEPARDDPQTMSIFEKGMASYRGQMEKTAKAAAKEFVEKQRLERKTALAKSPTARKSPAGKRDEEAGFPAASLRKGG